MILDAATLFRLMFLADLTACLLLLAYRDGTGHVRAVRGFVLARMMHGVACLLIGIGPALPKALSVDGATVLAYFAFALEGFTIARLRGAGRWASAIPFALAAAGALAHAAGLSSSASVGTAGIVCTLLFGYTSLALVVEPNRTPLVWVMFVIMASNCLGAAVRIYAGFVLGLTLADASLLQTGGLLTAYLFCVGGGVGFLLLLKEDTDRALRRAACSDPLTGLLNHRAFLDVVRRHLGEPGAQRLPVSLLTIDLDHFKAVNDRFGHQTGDDVLRAASAAAATVLADCGIKDGLGRIGGEEFAGILPCEAGLCLEIAEEIRSAIKALRFPAVTGLFCTASIGAAEARPSETLHSLMRRSDMALYEAKALGRDRVILADAAPTLHPGEREMLVCTSGPRSQALPSAAECEAIGRVASAAAPSRL